MSEKPGGQLSKVAVARIESGEITNIYEFQLNPEDISWERGTNWTELRAPGTTSNQAMFVNVDSTSITLKFLVARLAVGYRRGRGAEFLAQGGIDAGVLPDLAEIESWGLPSMSRFLSNQYEYIPPPTLLLYWGYRTWKVTARNIQVRETHHNEKLDPMIAEVTVTFKTHHDSFDELKGWMSDIQLRRDGVLA